MLEQSVVDEKVAQMRQTYHSINSLSDHEKIKAVSDKTLNPYLFDDPYDGIANSMSHWAQDAPQYAGRSDEDKQKIASKYYDEAIGPLYKNMGVAPLSKDVWLRQAWHAGLSYDPASAYRNSVLKGALHGATSASAQVLNAARTLTNLANLPIATYADSIKNKDITGLTGYYNLAINMHNHIKEEGSVITGVAKTIEDMGEAASTDSKWAHDLSSNQSFWRDVTPARDFTEKATSFVVENAMLLPFFGAIGKAAGFGVGLVGEAAEGIPMLKNLTQVLGATKLGQTAAKAMTYGTEGLIFGNLTTDVEDKKDAWKTALQFAAAGTLFSGLGKGMSKLKDMLPDGAEKASMEAAEHEAELGAQGKRSATPEEYLDQYRTHLASTMTAGGVPLTHAIIEEALAHVRMEEVAPLDAVERKTWYENKLADDPIHWKSMSPSITIIKQYLDKVGVKLSDMTPEQQQGLTDFLDHQVHQAAEEMDMRVPEIQRVKGKELMEDYMKTPEGEAEWKQELAKQQEAYKNQPDGAKKASIVAQAEMVKRRMQAVAKAAEDKNVTGPENVRQQGGVEPLPSNLKRSSPRYNSHPITWDDPRDMAAYVLNPASKNKSSAHDAFLEYYKRNMPENSLASDLHASSIRKTLKELATKASTSDEPLHVPSHVEGNRFNKPTPDPATAAQRTESRYSYDKSGKITGYQMAISFNWKAGASELAEAKGGKDSTKFWNEYVKHLVGNTDDDIGQAHALASDLRKYFNPLKDYGLTFEKANTQGGDWTNFLAFMYSYKDKLPGPIQNKLEDILMNSPKMSELLGSRPTINKIQEFGQAIQNHVDIFTRSKWYKEYGERNVFRSTQPGITGKDSLSKWQRDQKLMKSAHKADLDKAKEFFPGRSKAMLAAKQQYITALKLHQSLEMAAYLKGKPSRLAALMAKGRSIVSEAGESKELKPNLLTEGQVARSARDDYKAADSRSIDENLANILHHVSNWNGHSIIHLSPDAFAFLRKGGADGLTNAAGVVLPGKYSDAMCSIIERYNKIGSENHEQLKTLVESLRNVRTPSGHNIIIASGLSPEDELSVKTHEVYHIWQGDNSLTGTKAKLIAGLTQSEEPELWNKAWRKIPVSYSDSDAYYELPAYLAGGNHAELGLTAEEATKLLQAYHRSVGYIRTNLRGSPILHPNVNGGFSNEH